MDKEGGEGADMSRAARALQKDHESDSQQFLYDVSLCARRAIRKAKRAEQEAAKRERVGGGHAHTRGARSGPLRTRSAQSIDVGSTTGGGTMMVSSDALSISYAGEPRPMSAEGSGELPLLKSTGSPTMHRQQRKGETRADDAAAAQSLPRLSKSATLPATTLQPTVHPKLERSPLFTSTIAAHSTAARQANHDTRSGMSSSLGALGDGAVASAQQAALESTGPTNWSPNDLGIKYRGEAEREAAWQAYQLALQAAEMVKDERVVAVAEVERHPMHTKLDVYAMDENRRTSARARARGRMKRFVLDVHQVWLTNLEHLAEHRLAAADTHPSRGRGLAHRRDVNGICNVHSQIQSVAPERAWTITQPAINMEELEDVALHAVSEQPLSTPGALPIAPTLTCLVPGEPLSLIGRRVTIAIHRLKRPADADAYWRIACYTLEGGAETRIVVAEQSALPLVQALIRPPQPATAPTPVVGVRPAARRNPPHLTKICAPVRFGSRRQRCLVSIRVHGGGTSPVWIELSVCPIATRPTPGLHLKVRSCDVIRRLTILDAPALRLSWWQRAERAALWRSVVVALRVDVEEDGSPIAASLRLGRHDDGDDGDLPARGAGGLGAEADVLPPARTTFEIDEEPSQELLAAAHCLVPILTASDADDELTISVRNVPEEPDELLTSWEAEADFTSSLSMRVSGQMHRVRKVPGVKELEHMGVWFKYPWDKEFTRAFGTYFRDASLSSTDSVLVTLLFALDTAILAPVLLAWQPHSMLPFSPPNEDPDFMIAPAAAIALTLMSEPVQSDLDTRVPVTVVVLTYAERELDFASADPAAAQRASHRRRWSALNRFGFRQTARAKLLMPDPTIPTFVFSLTKKGATANGVGLVRRNMWHSQELCASVLCRARTCEDYVYIAHNTKHQGANDPGFYTIHLRHEKLYMLVRGGLETFIREDNRVRMKKEADAKEKALADKIEAGRQLLEARKKQEELLALQQHQEKLQRTLRAGGAHAAAFGSATESLLEPEAADAQEDTVQRMAGVVKSLAANERLLKMLAEQLGIPPTRVMIPTEEDADEDITEPQEGTRRDDELFADDDEEGGEFSIPQLELEIAVEVKGQGWRSLQREPVNSFYARATQAHTQGGRDSKVNTVSKMTTVDLVDPLTGIRYKQQEFPMEGGSFLYIADPLADTVRVLEMARLQRLREEAMAGGGAQTQIALANSGDEMSSADKLLVQTKDPDAVDAKARLEAQAILCAKSGSLEGIEDALDQDVRLGWCARVCPRRDHTHPAGAIFRYSLMCRTSTATRCCCWPPSRATRRS